jgi:hypothetical protein
MLDPGPGSLNADPKHWLIVFLFVADPRDHHGRGAPLRLHLHTALLRPQLHLVLTDLLHVSHNDTDFLQCCGFGMFIPDPVRLSNPVVSSVCPCCGVTVLCKCEMRSSLAWMRCSLAVRASDCQSRSCNRPGFDPSILRYSGM